MTAEAPVFERDGEELFGKLIEEDDARNRAAVVLIPSGEVIDVSLDDLTKVNPDPDVEENELHPDESRGGAARHPRRRSENRLLNRLPFPRRRPARRPARDAGLPG